MTDQKSQNLENGEKEKQAAEEKLIAGKFKTQEALVGAYEELQRAYTKKSQESADWQSTVADLMGDQRNSQDTDDGEDKREKFNQDFLSNPKQTLDTFADRLSKKVMGDVSEFLSARDAVSIFTANNPTVREHPALFAEKLAATNSKDSLSDRLDVAMKEYSAEMKKIEERVENRRKQQEEFERKNKADAADVGPGASRDLKGKSKPEDEEETGESFDDYVAERRKERSRITSLLA